MLFNTCLNKGKFKTVDTIWEETGPVMISGQPCQTLLACSLSDTESSHFVQFSELAGEFSLKKWADSWLCRLAQLLYRIDCFIQGALYSG